MSEEITTTETAAEAVEFGAESVESARAIVEAERVMPTDFAHNAAIHYAKALRKHPRFADALFSEDEKADAEYLLERARAEVDYLAKNNWLDAGMLAMCELGEAQLAHARGDKAATISELYDAVAVLMRMIAVVEGRQKLGGVK